MADEKPECFVIMPVTDPDGYSEGHFQRVYQDIITPACEKTDHKPIRANDVQQTNLIHLDILQKIIESPMALCDLSSRNPNVMFELGIRQAFDKPVVLIRETGTPDIFDIAPLRYTEYRRERVYDEVIEDQQKIADAIGATAEATQKGTGINSIVNLLSLTSPALLKEFRQEESPAMLQVILAEIGALKKELNKLKNKDLAAPEAIRPIISRDAMSQLVEDHLRIGFVALEAGNYGEAEDRLNDAIGFYADGKALRTTSRKHILRYSNLERKIDKLKSLIDSRIRERKDDEIEKGDDR